MIVCRIYNGRKTAHFVAYGTRRIPLGAVDQTRLELQPLAERFRPDYSDGLCARLNDKWTVVVLWRIASAPERRIRFSSLKHEVDGITQRMLTLTLRNLERDGLVLRHLFAEIPPRVEYEISELGIGMLEALEPINRWIAENKIRVDRCRRAYDASPR